MCLEMFLQVLRLKNKKLNCPLYFLLSQEKVTHVTFIYISKNMSAK